MEENGSSFEEQHDGDPRLYSLNGFRPSYTLQAEINIIFSAPLAPSVMESGHPSSFCPCLAVRERIMRLKMNSLAAAGAQSRRRSGFVLLEQDRLCQAQLSAKDFASHPDHGTAGIISQRRQLGQQTCDHRQQLLKRAQTQTSICPAPVYSSTPLGAAHHLVLAPNNII